MPMVGHTLFLDKFETLLSSEVVVHDALRIDAERVEHGDDGLRHGARTTHVVFDILGSIVVLQIGVEHHLMDEARSVLHASSIGCGVWTVEGEVEVEVGILLLQAQEVVEIEHLVERAGTIEVVHLAILGVQRLGHVHDLCAQRSHTGTTTNPDHLLLRVEVWVEVAERTTHDHLVARFQREDVRRGDTGVDLHEATLVGLERRRGDTNGEHEHITLGRIVGHRVSTNGGLGVLTLQREESELLP